MTTLEIEVALLNHYDVKQYVMVNGTHWGIPVKVKPMHECDMLLLNKSGYATEIEIKISKQDLLKDKEKLHGHNHNLLKYLYFAVPEELKDLALKEIPERAGLIVITKNNRVSIIRKPLKNKSAIAWNEAERYNLMRLGTMRIKTLKTRLLKEITKGKQLLNERNK